MSLNRNALISEAYHRIQNENNDIISSTSELICYFFDNCEIDIPDDNRFFVNLNCEWIMNSIAAKRAELFTQELFESPLHLGEKNFAYTGSFDFGHTSADFDSVIGYGIYGLRCRLASYVEKYKNNGKVHHALSCALSVYDAALRLMRRVASVAYEKGKLEMADGLMALTESAPKNLFEAMQTTVVYYHLQTTECAVLRTVGRLDSLYIDFYNRETDEGYVRRLVRDLLRELDSFKLDANLPIALGAAPNGVASNSLTEIFLSEYRAIGYKYIKFHILYKEDTSIEVLKEAFASIREGHNSIMFMSDSKITESLVRLGEDADDAKNYHVVGCYECGGRGELTCSCAARVNLAKAVEYTLTGGVDMLTGDTVGLTNTSVAETFDEFFDAFLLQAEHLSLQAMKITEHYERHFSEMFAAPILSSTYASSLDGGGDLYANNGAKYNNSSLNALGLATATDSLVAIKKLVWEDKELSLSELSDILRSDFEGNEELRLKIKTRFPHFGVGNSYADAVASRIIDRLGNFVNRRPNARGGIWRLGAFSIDWRHEFGLHTAATADGRHAGEPVSQNTGATFGKAVDGATAHMRSVAALDNTLLPNGSVLDLDLHASAVRGDLGISAMISGLRAFFQLGGFSVHYNVLDTETLRRANESPSDYPDLQVRLCGWNVRFLSLGEKEREEFVKRSLTSGI